MFRTLLAGKVIGKSASRPLCLEHSSMVKFCLLTLPMYTVHGEVKNCVNVIILGVVSVQRSRVKVWYMAVSCLCL